MEDKLTPMGMNYQYSESECKLTFTVKSEHPTPTGQEILNAILSTLKGLSRNKDLIPHQIEEVKVLDTYLDGATGMKITAERDSTFMFNDLQMNPCKELPLHEPFGLNVKDMADYIKKTGIWPVPDQWKNDTDDPPENLNSPRSLDNED